MPIYGERSRQPPKATQMLWSKSRSTLAPRELLATRLLTIHSSMTPSPPSPLTTTMKNPWLLCLVPLLLAVSSSLPLTAAMWRPLRFSAAGQSPVECVGDGVYAANSTYQANLRRVAALLLAEVSTTPGQSYAIRAVGYWPNRLMASSLCWRGGYRCADCIAGAFLEVERACPYRREALFSDRNCTLELAEIRIFGTGGIFDEGNILKQVMASGLVFQAIGFGCLFFLLFQEWRSHKRGTLTHSTPLLSGD